MVEDRDFVSMKDEDDVVRAVSNGDTVNYLERSPPPYVIYPASPHVTSRHPTSPTSPYVIYPT